MKKFTRSMTFKLLPTNRKQEKLEKMQKEMARLANFVVNKFIDDLDDGSNYSKTFLQDNFVYGDAPFKLEEKSSYINKTSLSMSIIEKVNQNLGYYITNRNKENIGKPTYKKFIHFRSRLAKFCRTEKGYWTVRLSFPEGYIYIKISENERNDKMIEKLRESEGEREWSCEIFKKNGDWFISPHYKIEVPEPPDKDKIEYFIGIDRGIRHPAVVTVLNRDKEVEQVEFIDQNNLHERRKNLHRRISELQEKGKKELSNKLKRKDGRIAKTGNHKISRKIVDIAEKYKPSIIVFEDLENIKDSLKIDRYDKSNEIKGKKGKFYNKIINHWSPQMMSDFTEYKAEEEGIDTIYINAKGTSYTCPKCNSEDKENRKETQPILKCKNCEYEANADYVGARNTAERGIDKL